MKITDFSPLFHELETLDANSLIIFDVDETLIVPKDKILRPSGEKHVTKLSSGVASTLSEEEQKELRSITLLQREIAVTDPSLFTLFEKIKEKQIPAIALTALFSGKYGQISSLEQWRQEELKCLGIDFTPLSPYADVMKFEEFGLMPPLFYHGILYSSIQPKGLVLKTFLEKACLNPSRILFIDDRYEQLLSVEEELKKMGIPYLGFHYNGLHSQEEEISEEIARFQFQYLLTHKTWLSDAEALKMMQ